MAAMCNPRDNTARVLQSANANDLHPDWKGESYIGTSWGLVPDGSATRNGVEYLEGNLYSPRGGYQGRIFVLKSEWGCED